MRTRSMGNFSFILDLIFPDSCSGCGKAGILLCKGCTASITFLSSWEAFYPEKVLSACDYNTPLLSRIIHDFKYKGLYRLAEPCTKILLRFLKTQGIQFDREWMITAIPLHEQKLKARGFNQAALIAQSLATQLNLPYTPLLRKTRATRSQMGLDKRARISNLRGCFELNGSPDFRNKKVLIIDDVVSTGSTISECAKVLRDNGVREVCGLTLSRN